MARRILAAVALAFGLVLLAACGVALLGKDDGGVGAVDWATVSPAEVERLIVAGKLDPNGRYKGKGATPLIMLVGRNGNPDVADVLVRHGAVIDEKTTFATISKNALALAVYGRNVAMVRRLLELGADASPEDRENVSPIFDLLDGSDQLDADTRDIFELLLAHGADVNALDYRSVEDYVVMTPLMHVLGKWTVDSEATNEMVSYLVERGADVNVRPNRSIMTPMHVAMVRGDVDVLRNLVARGGDVNIMPDADIDLDENFFGVVNPDVGRCLTPLGLFAINGHDMEMFDLLVASGADLDFICPGTGVKINFLLYVQSRKEADERIYNSLVDIGHIGKRRVSFDEWRAVGDKMLSRIKKTCEIGEYDICQQLEDIA